MIIRRRHTANFTTISNTLFDDARLKADEVGILAYLLSRPHDWEVRRPALQRRWGIGREAMKRVIWNWIKTGWCWPIRSHAPNGTTFVIYDIRDIPGPEMTDEEVRAALSLGSSEAGADDDSMIVSGPEDVSETGIPPTGYPSLAHPSPVDPPLAYKDIPNKDLPRDESDQKTEREGARAREKHALHLADFKRRWPTIASDDQSRIDEAWYALTPEEGEASLAGIAPFIEKLKRDKRTTVPAGWKYLREKRWTLLDQAKVEGSSPPAFVKGSIEARAIVILHDIGGVGEFFRHVWRTPDGGVSYRGPVDDRLRAVAQATQPSEWVTLNREQAGAWERFLRERIFCNRPRRMAEGSRAPWTFPPSATGKLYPLGEEPPEEAAATATGPPETLMNEQDAEDFK
jgi:hypothetical protein